MPSQTATRDLRIQTPRAFLPFLEPARYKGAYGGRGSGKCLGRGTLVMKFDGSLAPVEDIVVGDALMGPDSRPREVLATTRGVGPLFRVHQRTAESYVVNDAHVLALQRSQSARTDYGSFSAAGKPQRPNGRYAGYGKDVTLISALAYSLQTERFKSQVFGYKVPVAFVSRATEIDPYILGLWLGDGSVHNVAFTTMDREVVSAIYEYAESQGFSVSVYRKPDSKAATYNVHSDFRRETNSLSVWRSLDLLYNKHVPEHYIVNDERVRLELLAGFVDTDGYVDGYVSISQKSERLIDDFKRVADSLGFKTSKSVKVAQCLGQPFLQYTLSIGGDIDRIPCRIARKRRACQAVRKNKDWRRTRVDVEPIGAGDYFGFMLDGDHLFLLADGTVTHNSHSFAEMLIERCLMEPGTRAVCIREIQLSLKQSVKRLLDDKIKDFGVTYAFRSLETHIETPGDGIIIFQGMQSHNADTIKSLEAYNIAWVEEAQSFSQRSLDLLRPTLREEDSELWFTWNPRNPTDPVDNFLRGTPAPPNSVVRRVSWQDNPFFPKVLRTEMEWDRRRDPDKYLHVWDGGYERNSESRVFKNWRVEEFETPANAILYCGGDWGFSVDPAVLVRCFLDQNRKTLYVDHEAYQVGVEIDHLPTLFDRVPAARELVIVADSARPETISYMKRHGFPRMEKSLKGKDSVKEGVIFLQGYDIVVHPRCTHTIDELTMYSYKTDKLTGMVTNVLEDKKNHVIDSLRYAVERLRKATAEGTWGR
jgi:phage terminase large subunit